MNCRIFRNGAIVRARFHRELEPGSRQSCRRPCNCLPRKTSYGSHLEFTRAHRGDAAGELPAPANTDPVTLHLNEVNVRLALEMLSRSHGLSILVAPGVAGLVTANLEGLPVDQALDAIIKLGNLVAHREGELIYVYSATEFPQANFRVHVFPLDYVSAVDVLPVVTNLLTPTGQVNRFECQSDRQHKGSGSCHRHRSAGDIGACGGFYSAGRHTSTPGHD